MIGGHLDSWDVGQGAQDDGASIIACLQALAIINKLGLEPQRTLRVAFWVNEENGGRGGEAYRAWVGDKIKDQVAAIEMDGGAEAPRGYGAGVDDHSLEMLTRSPSCWRRSARARFGRAGRFGHSAAGSRRRGRPFREHRGHALLRLAPHGGGYAG